MNQWVDIVAYRHPYLDDLVMVNFSAIHQIFSGTPRGIKNLIKGIHSINDIEKYKLEPKEGVILFQQFVSGKHGVVLWRGIDRNYFYFDPKKPNHIHDIVQYSYMDQFPETNKIYSLHRRLQGEGCHTCGHHAIAFVDFLCKTSSYLSTSQIANWYEQLAGYHADIYAVQMYENILSEFNNSIQVRDPNMFRRKEREIYGEAHVSAASIAARVARRRRKQRKQMEKSGN